MRRIGKAGGTEVLHHITSKVQIGTAGGTRGLHKIWGHYTKLTIGCSAPAPSSGKWLHYFLSVTALLLLPSPAMCVKIRFRRVPKSL